MRALARLVVFAAALLPGAAGALDLAESRALVRGGDTAAVETAFAAHQAAFAAGEIGADAFTLPYGAFATTDPAVLALIEDWNDTMPESPLAMTAKAASLVHLVLVLRGEDDWHLSSFPSLNEAYRLYTEAKPLMIGALEREPAQVYAARLILDAAPIFQDLEAIEPARKAMRDHADHERLFLFDLEQAGPKWGGGKEEMEALCHNNDPAQSKVTAEECEAIITLTVWKVRKEVLDAAIETLGAADDRRFVELRARNMVALWRGLDARDLYERTGFPVDWSSASKLARGLGDTELLERLTRRWLEFDPYHPRHLANLAWALDMAGDTAGAMKSADDAMRYGSTIPDVRAARMWAMSKDPERQWDLLAEFDDAIAATGGHPEITARITAALIRPAEFMTHDRDGTPIEDFECRRLRIYAKHMQACMRTGSTTRNCTPDALDTVFGPAMDEARRSGQCRDMQKTTWRELVEEWLR